MAGNLIGQQYEAAMKQASIYPSPGFQATNPNPTAVGPNRMENLSSELQANAMRLTRCNNDLQAKLDRFEQNPTGLPISKAEKQPDPIPGTLNALFHWARILADETSRYEGLIARLSEII